MCVHAWHELRASIDGNDDGWDTTMPINRVNMFSPCAENIVSSGKIKNKQHFNGVHNIWRDGEAEKMDLCQGNDGCTPDAAANHISSVVGVLLQDPSFHQSSNKFEVVGYLFWKKGSRVWHLGLNHAVSAPHTNIFILVDSLLINTFKIGWEPANTLKIQ